MSDPTNPFQDRSEVMRPMPNDTAPAWDGVPLNPAKDAYHWLMRKGGAWAEAWRWDPDADGCGTEYSGAWAETDGDGQPDQMARWYAYLGPCLTPFEVTARERAAAAASWMAAREACASVAAMAHLVPPDGGSPTKDECAVAEAAAQRIRALQPPADASAALAEMLEQARRKERNRMAGEIRCEAEQERDEFFNMLGRITSELGLPMSVTAGRIIEAIYALVAGEREACASVRVTVTVPDGAESWTPLEAWEEALIASDETFRAAIRARAGEGQA